MDDSSPPELPVLLEAQSVIDLSPAAQGAMFLDESAIAINASKLAALEGMAGLLGRDLSYQDFMREILLVFLKAIKCEAGSLFEAEPDGKVLFFRAVAGQSSDQLDSIRIPAGKGIVGHVHESRQITHVADCGKDDRFLKTVGDAVGFQTRNLIAAPLIIRGRVFGVVEVINRMGEAGFTSEDIELIGYLCDAASKFIEARLVMNWVATLGVPEQKAA